MAINTNFTIQFYVCTFVMRSMWSLFTFIISCVGFSVVKDDLLGNRAHIGENNELFGKLYFGLTSGIEFTSIALCLWLYRKQQSMQDLKGIVQLDNQSSCFFLILRILVPVAMGIISLSGINSTEKGHRYRPMPNGANKWEWDALYSFILSILLMEVMTILWFAYSMLNQPTNTVREVKFDGIITEMNALE